MKTFNMKLAKYGWRSLSDGSLMSMKKKELIQVIRNLEHNYACTLERLDNQTNYINKHNVEKISINDNSLDSSVES